MAIARAELDPANKRVARLLRQRLIAAHDRIFSDANKQALKHLVINLSLAGFAVHLLLIFLARTLPQPPALLAELGRNYLTAISTPFNFILFYEVLTLIAALPASTTRSIANQFEVVSLIFTRNAFKDVDALGSLVRGQPPGSQAMQVFLHMGAGLVMFLLVAVFQYVALQRVRPLETPDRPLRLERFISQKKIIALGLTGLLLTMAVYNLTDMIRSGIEAVRFRHAAPPAGGSFYSELFTVMIFTDVLILILSLVISGQYAMVFRNAAFVLSIILMRFSLTVETPYGTLLALTAMAFGVCTLLVFNFHMRIENRYASTGSPPSNV